MIRTVRVIYCGNEHGTGDVSFPDINDTEALSKQFIDGTPDAKTLRKRAKEAGWGKMNGDDYCPGCMDADRSEG